MTPHRITNHERRIKESFIALTIVFLLVLLGFVFQIHKNRQLAGQGQEAHDALCVFKADLEARYGNGLEFIRSHPAGIPGIPVTVLRNSLNNQKATLESLAALDCVPPPKEK